MYRKIMLTILTVLAAVVVVKVMPPRATPAPPAPAIALSPEERLLATRVPQLSLHGVVLPKAIELLTLKTGVPIKVDWDGMLGFHGEKIDLDVYDARLDEVIAALFDVNRINDVHVLPYADIGATPDAIIVAGPFELPFSSLGTRVYDVGDLLTERFWAFPVAAPNSDPYASRERNLAAFASQYAGMINWNFPMGGFSDRRLPNGISYGDGFMRRLIVCQTHFGQRRVADFLAAIRRESRLARPGESAPPSQTIDVSQLERRISEIDFRSTPLDEAFTRLAALSKANMLVDWSEMQAATFHRSLPVNLRLRDVSLGTALNELIACAGRGTSENSGLIGPGKLSMSYGIAGDMIIVSDVASIPRSVRCFSVADFVRQRDDPPIPPDPNVLFGPSLTRNDLCHLALVLASVVDVHEAVESSGSTRNDGTLAVLATQILSHGSPRQHRQVSEALESLRHPILASSPDMPGHFAATLQRRIANFQFERAPATKAIEEWIKAAGPDFPIRVSPDINLEDRDVTLDLKNPSLGEVLEAIIKATGYTSVGTYEDDGILHIAAPENSEMVRAYDISRLTQHPEWWRQDDARGSTAPASEEDKAIGLIGLVCDAAQAKSRDHRNAPGASRDQADFMGYWHGLWLTKQTAEVHHRIQAYLRSIEQTGHRPMPEEN